MAKYRVGVIGHTGKGNYGHAVDTVWLHLDNTEIVGVADADEAGRKAAQKRLKTDQGFASYVEMLDKTKPQIVSIGPRWVDQHRAMVLAAAERGIHIYMEKPFCRDLQEADEMVAACEKRQVKLAIAHQTRYSPRLQTVRDLIYDGKLGQILEIRGRGKEDRRGGGEDLWVLGSHVMNLMHYFGGEPTWCYAQAFDGSQRVTSKHVRPGNEGIGPLAADRISAVYGLQDQITGYFASTRNQAGGRFGIQIFGSKGIVEILTGYMPAIHYLDDPSWSPGRSGKKWQPVTTGGIAKPEPLSTDSHLGNVTACQDLIAAIEENREPECSMYEARTTIEMIAGVFESHRLNKPVDIPLANRVNPLSKLT